MGDSDSDLDTDTDPDPDTATEAIGREDGGVQISTDEGADGGSDTDTSADEGTDCETATDDSIDSGHFDSDSATGPDSALPPCTHECAWGEGDCVWGYEGMVILSEACPHKDQICCDASRDTEPSDTSIDTDNAPISFCSSMLAYDRGTLSWYERAPYEDRPACGYDILDGDANRISYSYTGDGEHFAALSAGDYSSGAMCGACVSVTRNSNGASVVATVVDVCDPNEMMGCIPGHLTLSRSAYAQLADPDTESRLGLTETISWRVVDCPVQANTVHVRLLEPSNPNWNRVLIAGTRYPVATVKAGGMFLTRYENNYFGDLFSDQYSVEIQDINGAVIRTSVKLQAGSIDTGQQFPMCR